MNPDAEHYPLVERENIKTATMLKDNFLNLPFSKDECIADAGCGSGKHTKEILLPACCRYVEKVYAFDVSKSMILKAQEVNAHPKIQYVVADLEDRSSFPVDWKGKFSKVFSNYSLHWLRDTKRGFQNINYILQPGGYLAANFVVKANMWDVAEKLRYKSAWKVYCNGSVEGIPSIYYTNGSEESIKQWLEESGFDTILFEKQLFNHEFNTMENLKEALRSIGSYYMGIPVALKDAYVEEYAKHMLEVEGKYNISCIQVTVIGRKKCDYLN